MPFGCGVVSYGVWGDGKDYAYMFVCLWDFLCIVIAYDYGCGRGVFYGGHFCPLSSFCGGCLV